MQQKSKFQIGTIISLPSVEFPQRKFKIVKEIGEVGQDFLYLVQPQEWGSIQKNLMLKFQYEMKTAQKEFFNQLINYQNKEGNLPLEQRSQIIRIYEIVEYQGSFILIMEHGQETLYDYIEMQKGKFSIQEKIKILKEISQSIRFLHQQDKIHRNIKPESFIKVQDEFKLIEFDLIKSFQFVNTVNIGSPTFQAPELRNRVNSNYSTEVDIWSLGGTFYEVLTEQQFEVDNLKNFQLPNKNSIPNNLNIQIMCQNLLQNMLQQETKKRISIQQVIESLNQITNSLKSNQNSNFQNIISHKIFNNRSFYNLTSPLNQSGNSINNFQIQHHQNLRSSEKGNNKEATTGFLNSNPNNNNNALKLELENLLEQQFTKHNQSLFQNFTQFQVKVNNMIEKQNQIVNQQNMQNLVAIQNLNQIWSAQYQDIKQLIQEKIQQTKVNIENQQNNEREQINGKLDKIIQLLVISQKDQKDISQELRSLQYVSQQQKDEILGPIEILIKQKNNLDDIKRLIEDTSNSINLAQFQKINSQLQTSTIEQRNIQQNISEMKGFLKQQDLSQYQVHFQVLNQQLSDLKQQITVKNQTDILFQPSNTSRQFSLEDKILAKLIQRQKRVSIQGNRMSFEDKKNIQQIKTEGDQVDQKRENQKLTSNNSTVMNDSKIQSSRTEIKQLLKKQDKQPKFSQN